MAKRKYNVGDVSFTEAGYEILKGMNKDAQISYISERLNPKDNAKAEQLLKNVPNADNSSRSDKQSGKSTATSGNGNGKDNTEKSTTATS